MAMEIAVLREIGRRLLTGLKGAAREKTALSKGAGGDRTYPVDKKAEEIILSGLEASGEPLTVISEEAGIIELKGGGTKVLIDPIDGSRNAIAGIPFYCTSIALAEGEKIRDIELSYVLNLASADEFWALRGKGAYLNGERMYAQKDEVFYLVAYETQNPAGDMPAILPVISRARKARCFGATALDLAYLSSGAISVFLMPSPSRSFDFGGGYLMVMEAGGVFTDIEGRDLGEAELGLKRASSLLAAGNAGLHETALKLLAGKRSSI